MVSASKRRENCQRLPKIDLVRNDWKIFSQSFNWFYCVSDLTVKRDPYKNSSSNRTTPTQAKVENEDNKNNQNLYVPPPSREKNNLVRAEQLHKDDVDTGQPPPRPPLPRDDGKNSKFLFVFQIKICPQSVVKCVQCP